MDDRATIEELTTRLALAETSLREKIGVEAELHRCRQRLEAVVSTMASLGLPIPPDAGESAETSESALIWGAAVVADGEDAREPRDVPVSRTPGRIEDSEATQGTLIERGGMADARRDRDDVASVKRNETEATLRLIIDAVPALIGYYDRELTYRFVNAEYSRFLGLASEAILGRTVAEVVGEEIFAELRPGMESALKGERVRVEGGAPRRKDSSVFGWTEENYIPRFGPDGRVEGLFVLAFDITERKRIEQALRQSEARLGAIFANAPVGLSEIDRNGRFRRANAELCRILGRSEEEILELGIADITLVEDVPPSMAALAHALGSSRVVSLDKRYRRPDGTIVWANSSVTRLHDSPNDAQTLLVVTVDLTLRRKAEQALRESEERMRTLVQGIPQLIWRAASGGEWTWSSPQWTAYTGQPEQASLGLGWLAALHPDDRADARLEWVNASGAAPLMMDTRIYNHAQDRYRWFTTRAVPVLGADGRVVEWLGTSTDVHELRDLQERQHVLVAELQHRTRNLMGIVRSTTEATLRGSGSLDEFALKFRDHIEALSRVQGLLARLEGSERITFDELIRSEMAAIGAPETEEGKVTLQGPMGVRLRSSMVQTFALALHELATNAVKYGALAQAAGRLSITWRLEAPHPGDQPWLHVDWKESGVAMPPIGSSPQGDGQGRELIERALPYQFGARTTYALVADGIQCSISLPVSKRGVREDGVGGSSAEAARSTQRHKGDLATAPE